MFKLTSNYILGALAVFAYASIASAAPSQLDARATDTIILCREENFESCVNEEVDLYQCRDFNAFNGLGKNISSAKIPLGLACTFYRDYFCPSGGPDDSVTLGPGDYPDFTKLPKDGGYIDFNNAADSVTCVWVLK